ncbi:MAG TPA: hypothetical protein VLF41_00175 [Candidatus Nanoarchaeia archaeon]|nr:hypothetical protein [Candidatus Nanoarchaeia archaeon]
MPHEDALALGENAYVVADGIARDPIGIKDFTGKSMEELLESYPKDSGAALAAELFCRRFLKELSEHPPYQKNVQAAFTASNTAIAKLNRQRVGVTDYLVNDYCGCVAAAGMIEDGLLHWGSIGDSGVIIYDNTGQIRWRSPDGMATFAAYANKLKYDWNKPEGRKLIRSRFRNNPNMIVDDVCVSYGALTGEDPAKRFMNFGVEPVERGEMVLFYTDGLKQVVELPEFWQILKSGAEPRVKATLLPYLEQLAKADYERYGKERTLIAVSAE